MTSVAAVVVTFNRKALVADCLRQLFQQTRPLDRIYLIDNCSSDGTREHLAALGLLDRAQLRYVRLDTNTGGAGGFHEGMRRAYEDDFDWIWIMDDDGEPALDALALMARHFADPGIAAVMPMIADGKGDPDFSAPHRGFFKKRDQIGRGSIGRSITPAELATDGETVPIDYFSFVGPCFPRRVIQQVGLPKAEFFIHFDDIEYAHRIAQCGRAIVVPAAKILHKEAQTVSQSAGDGTAVDARVPVDRLWLRYYGYRNRFWLVSRGKLDAPLLPMLVYHLRIVAGTLLYDDRKWQRLRFWNAALIDGFRGCFDNDRPKRILAKSA